MFGARPADEAEPIPPGTYYAINHRPLTFSHTDCN
jgi:hypothetical protein